MNTDRDICTSPTDTVLRQHIVRFLAVKARAWRPATERQYRLVLGGLARSVGDVWPLDYVAVMVYLNGTTVNDTSVRTYFRYLKAFFNYLEATGVITSEVNPATQVSRLGLLPRPDKLPPVALSQEEIDRLFTHLERQAATGHLTAIRDLALFRLAYVTGCRTGEVISPKWADVDLDGLAVTVRQSKSHRFRVVYFNS